MGVVSGEGTRGDKRERPDAPPRAQVQFRTNLFWNPVFKEGAFTANDPEVRRYAIQKTMRAIDLGAELGATSGVGSPLDGGEALSGIPLVHRPGSNAGALLRARALVIVVLRPATVGEDRQVERSLHG